jgi:hypothetical protein
MCREGKKWVRGSLPPTPRNPEPHNLLGSDACQDHMGRNPKETKPEVGPEGRPEVGTVAEPEVEPEAVTEAESEIEVEGTTDPELEAEVEAMFEEIMAEGPDPFADTDSDVDFEEEREECSELNAQSPARGSLHRLGYGASRGQKRVRAEAGALSPTTPAAAVPGLMGSTWAAGLSPSRSCREVLEEAEAFLQKVMGKQSGWVCALGT